MPDTSIRGTFQFSQFPYLILSKIIGDCVYHMRSHAPINTPVHSSNRKRSTTMTKQHQDRIYTSRQQPASFTDGWTSYFQKQLKNPCNDELIPARVVGVSKNNFRISNGKREWLATAAGRLKHHSDDLYPVTGDWVLVTDTVISEVLTRKNALSRGAAGAHGKQNGSRTENRSLRQTSIPFWSSVVWTGISTRAALNDT